MTEFTPWSALIGGGFIGLSALLLMLLIGKVAGCSGILTNIFKPYQHSLSEWLWRLCFVIGLGAGPVLASFFTDYSLPQTYDLSNQTILIGGFLVGLGAAIGAGCTSGHGICGMGRISTRSIIATLVFMGSAVITVFILNHLL